MAEFLSVVWLRDALAGALIITIRGPFSCTLRRHHKLCSERCWTLTPQKLISKHENLVHSELQKVVSHVQRDDGDWIINTVMIEGHQVPFRYKRKKKYKSLKGARVNMTYYPTTDVVAGMEFEVMHVVRIRIG